MEFIGERISFLNKESETSIVISSTHKKLSAYLMLLWLIAFAVCVGYIIYFLSGSDSKKDKLFVVILVAFWMYYVFKAYRSALWRFKGLEVIKIMKGKFIYKKGIKGKGKAYSYEIRHISDLQIKDVKGSIAEVITSVDFMEMKEKIAFRYFDKNIRFGYNLNENDSKELFKLIKFQLKKYA